MAAVLNKDVQILGNGLVDAVVVFCFGEAYESYHSGTANQGHMYRYELRLS